MNEKPKKVTLPKGKKSLAEVNPALAKGWHPTKNGDLTPNYVTPGSEKKVWWICKEGHEWEARINSRVAGNNCPYCSNRKVNEENCLKSHYPKLSKEWHPTKNGDLTPNDITPGSHKKVWWVCERGHEWQAEVKTRSSGHGCPYCSGHKVMPEDSLGALNPLLSKEWHPTKNGDLTPYAFSLNSNKKVWWICKKGHEWSAAVSVRNMGRGCPICYRENRKAKKNK
ncbi:zinc-ribbon domain-containing protein [bacterium]|nr:zinc-ribbon domain-containing protein [bacterium]